jgi:hypothetical protein
MKRLTRTIRFNDKALQIRADMYICVLHLADSIKRVKLELKFTTNLMHNFLFIQ